MNFVHMSQETEHAANLSFFVGVAWDLRFNWPSIYGADHLASSQSYTTYVQPPIWLPKKKKTLTLKNAVRNNF